MTMSEVQKMNDNGLKTCDNCMSYIGEKLRCQRCDRLYTRTNRTRHYRAFRCRINIFHEI